MIEVLFGESEAASMKAAKNREVICLGFMLDIGLCHKASGACGKKKKRHFLYKLGRGFDGGVCRFSLSGEKIDEGGED